MADPRAGLGRGLVLLLVAGLTACAGETITTLEDASVDGRVVRVERVHAGRGADPYLFHIRYRFDGRTHQFSTRRGVLDVLGAYNELRPGDRVPLRVSPASPYAARIDSFSTRYPISLSITAFGAILIVTLAVMIVLGRI